MSDKVHHLGEYAVAKQMTELIPLAVADLQKCMDLLYAHRGFNAVCDVIIEVDSAIMQLETRLPYFKNIVDNKGEV